MILNVFMDETSRTGQQRYNNNKWNFKDQPLFGLGALYIPQQKSIALEQELNDIINNEKIPGEFKWTNKKARNNVEKLFPVFMDIIQKHGAKVYFEIEDKRFSIAKLITEYCVFPSYNCDIDHFLSDENYHNIVILSKRAFASYIMDNISDNLLWKICEFFDSCDHNTTNLKRLIRELFIELNSAIIKKYCLITIDSIERVEKGKSPLEINNLFPIKDTIQHNQIKTNLAIDPHTDCFSDLLDKAIKFFPNYQEIKCFHDEQDQWKPSLEETINRIKKTTHPNYSIELYTKSGYDTIVNTVDYISGYLNKSLRQVFEFNSPLPEELKSLINSNTTILTSVSLYEKIWPDHPDIKRAKELYDAMYIKESQI